MEQHSLTVRPIESNEWSIMLQQGEMLVKTGFLPEAIKTKEQAVAIMLKGRELDIPAMYALSNIVVIKGKPCANAELMLALIYRDHGADAMLFTATDDQKCIVSYKRRGWTERRQYTFTIQDAHTAGLQRNTTWQQYPAAMLRARCISAVARMAFPDTIAGMYTPEEMGATVRVDEVSGATEIETIPGAQPVASPADAATSTQSTVLAPASNVADGPTLTCHDCGGNIYEGKDSGGTMRSIQTVAAQTKARWGVSVCLNCHKLRKLEKDRQAAASADAGPQPGDITHDGLRVV